MDTIEKDIERRNSPPNELEQLDIFVGKWNVEGQNLAGAPIQADAMVKGIATYEWQAGKFFLLSKWSRKFGDSSHIGMGITGYDPARGTFTTHTYDNIGLSKAYEVTVRRLTWKFAGPHERATMEFTPDGKTFTEYWEISTDGAQWEPLCRLTGVRVV